MHHVVQKFARVSALAASLLLAMCASGIAQRAYPQADEPRALTSTEVDRLMQVLLDRRAAEHWRFNVGRTVVLQRTLRQSAGAERGLPSRDWLQKRQDFAEAALALYADTKRRLGIGAAQPGNVCDPTATAFNWLAQGRVLPPRDQRISVHVSPWCGSCWAFAPIAAYESSYLLENAIAADPANPALKASEQQLLNCTPDSNCTLGYVSKALDLLVLAGTASRTEVEYDGVREPCIANLSIRYPAVAWGPLSLDASEVVAPSRIKEALCRFGPVTSRIILTYGFGTYIGDGVFHQVDNVHTTGDAHHLVIIGWDETKGSHGAWLVKNSWVEDWGLINEGMPGYGWIEYGANLIGHHANWVLAFHDGVTPADMGPAYSDLKRKYLAEP